MAIDHFIEKDLAKLQIQYIQQTTIDKYFLVV
jgi:hypothetical protein